jgi:hypothetical protein
MLVINHGVNPMTGEDLYPFAKNSGGIGHLPPLLQSDLLLQPATLTSPASVTHVCASIATHGPCCKRWRSSSHSRAPRAGVAGALPPLAISGCRTQVAFNYARVVSQRGGRPTEGDFSRLQYVTVLRDGERRAHILLDEQNRYAG